MPRPVGSTVTPSYRHHKPSGLAVCTIDGRDVYLGPWKSKASKIEYDRVIGEWLANGRCLPTDNNSDLRIVELVKAYWRHAHGYYFRPGENNGELGSIKLALHHLKKLYSQTRATDFGPLALKAVRQSMVDAGWSRRYVNCQVNRIRRVFKWATEMEMVPPSVHHGLQAVAGLKAGRSDAPESAPVLPVPDATVDATLLHVSPTIGAMIQLQRLTGMRPGEVCAMRTMDLDTTGRLWLYKPASHKTAHHGHERTIYFGPQAQEVVGPYIRPNLKEYLFRPVDSEAWRREQASAARKASGTPLSCGNRPGTNRKAKPGRKPGTRYTVDAYRRAIAYAVEKAFGMPDEYRRKPGDTPEQQKEKAKLRSDWHAAHGWHPHQLRHNAATRLRKDFGLEAAQVILGHRTLTVTQVYAEKNITAAQRIMGEVG